MKPPDSISIPVTIRYRLTKQGKAILERERRIHMREVEDNEEGRKRYLAAADQCIAAIRAAEAAIEDIDKMLKEEEAEA